MMTLRRRRETIGWTRAIAAARAGVTPESVKNWEKGRIPKQSEKFTIYVSELEKEEMLLTQAGDPVLHDLLQAAQDARQAAATELPNSPQAAAVVALFDDAIHELLGLMPTHEIESSQ